ncbi:MAG TPA: SAM-dependent chlorinase/fluorinase [Candidatus Acidoferrales bacterium]|nr:SAM-dependent chlorinase/fluorinase [Candidatus Acidoferrales bacterium]
MTAPLITLTTDFGTADHLVGVMKGVIAGIHPEARVYDITHNVSPFDVLDGALIIAQAYRYWPPRTIHVVVVDPGVGSLRRPLLVRAGMHYFLAPDNGVLSLVLEREAQHRAWHVTAERYFLQPVSSTFHGRDVFAPAAAWLARNEQPETFGAEIADLERLQLPAPRRIGAAIEGVILRVDHFGNMLTNLRPADAPQLAPGTPFRLKAGAAQVTRLVRTFAEGGAGEPCLVLGSSGYFEVCVNRGRAADAAGAGAGLAFRIELG